MTQEAADKASQHFPSSTRLHGAAASPAVNPDPGHLFGLDDSNRHNGYPTKTRDDKLGDAIYAAPGSGFRAAARQSAKPRSGDGGLGLSSTFASAPASLTEYGLHRNPEVRVSSSQHGVASASQPRSELDHSDSHCTHEQSRKDTLPRHGSSKSFGLSEYSASELSGSQADTLPAHTLSQPSPGQKSGESRHAHSSVNETDTVQHGMLQAVHASSKHDLLHAQHSVTGATYSPDEAPPPESAADPSTDSPAEAAARPVAHPAALRASEAEPAAAAAPRRAADSAFGPVSALSQMHESMRRKNCESYGCALLCHTVSHTAVYKL